MRELDAEVIPTTIDSIDIGRNGVQQLQKRESHACIK